MFTLKDWFLTNEADAVIAHGAVYGNILFPDGALVSTSRVRCVYAVGDGLALETHTGSLYSVTRETVLPVCEESSRLILEMLPHGSIEDLGGVEVALNIRQECLQTRIEEEKLKLLKDELLVVCTSSLMCERSAFYNPGRGPLEVLSSVVSDDFDTAVSFNIGYPHGFHLSWAVGEDAHIYKWSGNLRAVSFLNGGQTPFVVHWKDEAYKCVSLDTVRLEK